jgi:hypothetical protein
MHALASRPARLHPSCRGVEIARLTGPLDGLAGRRVLVLVDDENLRISARELGYRLSLRRLGERLRQGSACCSLHGFFSRDPGDERRCAYYRERGWVPHPRDVQVFAAPGGQRRHANSDVHLAFGAGVLISRSAADAVVLASGDGDLVCDLTRDLHELPRPRAVYTLSLAGSTSHRLDARSNPDLDGNIEVGLDCLHPLERARAR